jgi:hypothetical protein
MSKVLNILLSKSTLLKLEKQFVLEQGLQDKPNVLNMVIQCPAIYENIIHEQ